MRHLAMLASALALVACSTHEVDVCLPPCDALDQEHFAACVADGIEGTCLAGHRRCCALETGCLGQLDDQTVQSTRTCDVVVEEACYPPCDPMHEVVFDACVASGGDLCDAGDEECCALALDCLGELGDVVVYAEGCCADTIDCASDERCDPELWECVPVGAPRCGDGIVAATEECDDGVETTHECPYGAMSCLVCDLECREVPGVPSYCGDDVIDERYGEACEPPGTPACAPDCTEPVTVPGCFDGVQNGAETDIDCGGGECAPCPPGALCRNDPDCVSLVPECEGAAFCGSVGRCEVEVPVCDDVDTDPCTAAACEPGRGCVTIPTPELCDGFDQDCDRLVDEDCV